MRVTRCVQPDWGYFEWTEQKLRSILNWSSINVRCTRYDLPSMQKQQHLSFNCNLLWARAMVFNPLSTILQLYCGSSIGGGNRSTQKKTQTCRKSLTNFITLCCIEYTLPWVGFKLTTLVVIGTDYIGSCKFNYHTITTTTFPQCSHLLHMIQSHNLFQIWTQIMFPFQN